MNLTSMNQQNIEKFQVVRTLGTHGHTMNSPDIPLDIQLFLHSLCMWLQAAQAVTGIVHSPRCLVPVQWVGWETQLTTDGQSHSLSI